MLLSPHCKAGFIPIPCRDVKVFFFPCLNFSTFLLIIHRVFAGEVWIIFTCFVFGKTEIQRNEAAKHKSRRIGSFSRVLSSATRASSYRFTYGFHWKLESTHQKALSNITPKIHCRGKSGQELQFQHYVYSPEIWCLPASILNEESSINHQSHIPNHSSDVFNVGFSIQACIFILLSSFSSNLFFQN